MTILGQTAPAPAVPALTATARQDSTTSAATPNDLTGDQAAAQLGESIPLVWCRRQTVGNEDEPEVGGCWVSPVATEARFQNDASNNLTCCYQLVVSEGQIATLQAGDVWQGDEARGSWTQAYNARAGSWAPGNAVTQQYGYETTSYTLEASGQPWVGVPSSAWNSPGSIEAWQQALARVTIASRGEYVTSLSATATMVGWANFTVANRAASDVSSVQLLYTNPPSRRLPSYSVTRAPSLEPFRVQTELVELGVTYAAVTQDYYQAGAQYLVTIDEVNQPPLPLPVAPLFCGTGGTYAGLSTLSFSATFPSEDDRWRQQVHVFARGGCQATRLTEAGTGPSCWLPDLARYLLATSSRISADLIDTTNLTTACQFNQALGLRFNGVLSQPTNLRDWLQRIAPWFLLLVSNRGGALGLRPALPIDGSYRLNLSEITPLLELNESHLDPDSFQLDYVPTEQRQPICLQVLYRSQPANQPGQRQMIEVRFDGQALAGPYQQIDLSEFCCTLRHAIVAGAFELARRYHVTHSLRVVVNPIPELATLQAGDVIGVTMPRLSTLGSSAHRQLYQLANLTQDATGKAELSLTHFPVDAAGRSLVALSIASLTPNIIVPAARVVVAARVPTVGAGVRLLAPAAVITVAAQVPAWATLTGVQVPAAVVAVAALAPVVAAGSNVPAAVIIVAAHAPVVSSANQIVPAAVITVAGQVPTQAGPTQDASFSSVTLLLRMNGSNGSTTFTDISNSGHTFTAYGNAQISTAQSKFNGASALFDGSGDYITTTPATALYLTGNFTIECWVRMTNNNDGVVASSSQSQQNNIQIFKVNAGGVNGAVEVYADNNEASKGSLIVSSGGALSVDTWHHLALSRTSGSARLFVDGTQVGSTATGWTTGFRCDAIGTLFTSGTRYADLDFHGYIDEFRITKGVGRYTSNFTAPSAPFPGN
jgi:hypothetical protein